MGKQKENHTGFELYNYFMCMFISFSEIEIFSFNRIVKDFSGLSKEEFLLKLSDNFYVDITYKREVATTCFEMYLGGCWYNLICKEGIFDVKNPVDSLETHILAKYILGNILSIEESVNSGSVEYVGGQEGRNVLEEKVDFASSDNCLCVAFLLPPITMQRIQSIADAGQTMPPKTTWVEPKLQKG